MINTVLHNTPTPSNAQTIQTVGIVRDLGLILNTGFSASDYVAHTIQKKVSSQVKVTGLRSS